MEDERLHLCTHLGVLGPLRSDGRRRCLRCGTTVAASAALASGLETAGPSPELAGGAHSVELVLDGVAHALEAMQVAQTAEFDDFLDDLGSPLGTSKSGSRDVG